VAISSIAVVAVPVAVTVMIASVPSIAVAVAGVVELGGLSGLDGNVWGGETEAESAGEEVSGGGQKSKGWRGGKNQELGFWRNGREAGCVALGVGWTWTYAKARVAKMLSFIMNEVVSGWFWLVLL
jgi:hypothetical protein